MHLLTKFVVGSLITAMPFGGQFVDTIQHPAVKLAAARYVRARYTGVSVGFEDSTSAFTPRLAADRGRLSVHPPADAAAIAEALEAPIVHLGESHSCSGAPRPGCVDVVVRVGFPDVVGELARIWVYVFDKRFGEEGHAELEVALKKGQWLVTKQLQFVVMASAMPPRQTQSVAAVLAVLATRRPDTSRYRLIIDTTSLRSAGGFDAATIAELGRHLLPGMALGIPSIEAVCSSPSRLPCQKFSLASYQLADTTTVRIRAVWADVVPVGKCVASYMATFVLRMPEAKITAVRDQDEGICGS